MGTDCPRRSTVMQSRDPSTNVVLLEDAAAVLGVVLAASCMGLTSLTGEPTLLHPLTTYTTVTQLFSPVGDTVLPSQTM